MDSKPTAELVPIGRTVHPLQFSALSWHAFEWLVFSYVSRIYPNGDVRYLGQAGNDKGRDIWVDYKGKSHCYQCANYRSLPIKKAVDDINKLVVNDSIPNVLIIISGGVVSAKFRDKIIQYAFVQGIQQTIIWSGIELEEQLRKDTPDILERFFFGNPFPQIKTYIDSADEPIILQAASNLPRIHAFYGRKEEENLLSTILQDLFSWGMLIYGSGGMGKTWLAIRVAQLCKEHFVHSYFLSLKEYAMDDRGRRYVNNLKLNSLFQLFDQLARLLGRDEITKIPAEQRIELILSALVGSKTLLILDNLETLEKDEQDLLLFFLEQLPEGCKAILTSRIPIGNSIQMISLLKIDKEAALNFINDVSAHNIVLAQATKADYFRLYEEAAGNPLLIRWMIGQLRNGDRTELSEAIDFLRTCPPGNDPLEFIFGDVLGSLSDQEINILAILTFPSEPITVKAIAEISNLNEQESRQILKILDNRILVTTDSSEQLYSILPMVAQFLRRKLPEKEKEMGELVEKRAFKMIKKFAGEKHEHFLELNSSWASISPALVLFANGPNKRLQAMCEELGAFLNFYGKWDERLSLSQAAETRALKAKDFKNAFWVTYEIGYIHFLRNQMDDVFAYAIKVNKLLAKAQLGKRAEGYATRLYGLALKLKEDYIEAIDSFDDSIVLWQSIKEVSSDIIVGLTDKGDVEKDRKNYSKAENYYREGIDMAKDVIYPEGVAYITARLAGLAFEKEEWSNAEALARDALSLAEPLGRQETIAESCYYASKALLKQGQSIAAYPFVFRTIEILKHLNTPLLKDAYFMIEEYNMKLSEVDKKLE